MPNKKQLIQLVAILALTGCTSVADMVGYDTASLNETAAKNYSQVVQQAQSQRVLDNTSQTSRRIKTVFERLKPHANQANQTGVPFNWQMNVFRGNELNAWAMPGGKMAMYTGMVDRLKLTDDEIAAVIGHYCRLGYGFTCFQTIFAPSGERSGRRRRTFDGSGRLQSRSSHQRLGKDEQTRRQLVHRDFVHPSDQSDTHQCHSQNAA